MTVSTANNSTTGQGNGATTVFNYNFLMPAASDALITYTDPTGTQVAIGSTLYTITGIGNPLGGTVTYPLSGTPIPIGSSLIIERILPLVQSTSISNQGAFYPQVVETALDYEMMCIQQLFGLIGQIEAQIIALSGGQPIPPITINVLTVTQLKYQLVSIGQMYNVNNAILADVAAPENIQWTTGGNTVLGDALYLRVQTVLGYTASQMQSLYAAAASQPQ